MMYYTREQVAKLLCKLEDGICPCERYGNQESDWCNENCEDDIDPIRCWEHALDYWDELAVPGYTRGGREIKEDTKK